MIEDAADLRAGNTAANARMRVQAALQAGLRFQQAGRLAEAGHVYGQLLDAYPDLHQATHLLAVVALQSQDFERALQLIQQAIAASPGTAAYPEMQGRVLKAMGRIEEAVASYRSAIALDPAAATALVSLGVALKAQGRLDEAIECYRRALAVRPDLPEAHHNLGNALLLKGGAAPDWQQHIDQGLRPRMQRAEALQRQALELREQGLREEALASLRLALEQVPELAMAHNAVGTLLLELQRTEEAEPCFRKALELDPTLAPAHLNLGNVFWFQGLPADADACYARALALKPGDGVEIRRAMLLPVICRSVEEIATARAGYEHAVDRLLERPLRVAEPATEVAATSFYLSYHGLDNRLLQTKLSRLARHATPGLAWLAPHCDSTRRRNGRLRIGFISSFLRAHSIGRTTRGLIAELSRQDFEVFALFVPPLADDSMAAFIRAKADRCLDLPDSLEAARAAVASLELDVLFYQDIGMEPFTYYLAHARLAPVQCVSFGHPETTGIPNMDYFISSELFEPADGPRHYSENLIMLRDAGTLAYYYRPAVEGSRAKKSEFGVTEREHVYLCPQTLFKLHPEFDALLGGILRADPAGRVVLVEGKAAAWGRRLRERFANSIPDVAGRVSFLAQRGSADFLRLLAAADVILDTTHFNGMNTSLEAFAANVPVVTLPKAFQRGRHTQAMYTKMGFTECVAADEDDYIRIAARLGTDPAYNRHAREEIAARCGVLYEDRNVVQEFEHFFRTACADR